jgi:signal transduction histidine kinase
VWESNDMAQISISNQGGISGDRSAWGVPLIAEPFDIASGQQPDIGLGLPLAHRIITEHGGAFELHSVVDAVTRVVIILPLADLLPPP